MIPIGTPMTNHIKTETNTDESVIIDSNHMSQAPIKASNNAQTIENLKPTDAQLMAIIVPIVNHQGKCVR